MNEKRLRGMLGFAMRAGKAVLGTDTVCKRMAAGKDRISLLLITEDSSDNAKKKLTSKAEFYGIEYKTVNVSSSWLGELLGKTYSPVCVGIADDGFAKEIKLALEENN